LRPKAAEEALALPIHPELTDEQIVYVAGEIKEFLGWPAPAWSPRKARGRAAIKPNVRTANGRSR